MKNRFKLLATSLIGSSLEFYDLALFGFLTPILSPLFFPTTNPTVSMIASLGAFAAGFITRPLGAIFFGHIGDKYGRKTSLMVSIILIGLPTFFIGIMPTYEQIGILCPILVVLCRFFQGVCVGGEYNGSAIFFLEHCEPSKRGFFGGLISAAAVLGFFMASGVTIVCTQSWMPSWGWRLSFILGSAIALFGLYIRKDISETPEFNQVKQKQAVKKLPLMEIFRDMPLSALYTIGIGSCMGTLSLTLFGYMIPYLTKEIGFTRETAMHLNFIAIFWYMMFTPFVGYIADKIGPHKIMLFTATLALLCSKLIYLLLSSNEMQYALLGQLMLATLAASFLGPSNLLIYSVFPTALRYSGVSFNFSLGLAVLGGNAPLIAATLICITGDKTSPALYIMSMAIIGILSLLGIHSKRKAGFGEELAVA